MDNDRELLELAAKAADYRIEWCAEFPGGGCYMKHVVPEPPDPFSKRVPWNPLTDDGDALRLAAKLRLKINIEDYGTSVRAAGGRWHGCESSIYGESATRRAITKAAAEIGRQGKD